MVSIKNNHLLFHNPHSHLIIFLMPIIATLRLTFILAKKSSSQYIFVYFLGVFHMKQARSYSGEHCSTTDLNNDAAFPLQICQTDPQLIRIIFKSRHSKRKTYYTYVQLTKDDIQNSCCDCPSGDRNVGLCSH